ncbi:MAG: hypothetical protein P8074_24235, partial [Anaerolineales bacterium]
MNTTRQSKALRLASLLFVGVLLISACEASPVEEPANAGQVQEVVIETAEVLEPVGRTSFQFLQRFRDQEPVFFEVTQIMNQASLDVLEAVDERGTLFFSTQTPQLTALVSGDVLVGDTTPAA